MFKTLSYFEKQQTLAFHKVGEIYTDQNHPIHGQLIADLKSISASKIKAFETKYHYLFGRSGEDRDMDVRKMFFEYEIAGTAARKRLSILGMITKGTRQKPYDHDDFADIDVDDHGLVSVRQLRSDHFSLFNKDYAYQLCPCLDQFNSSHWLGLLILNETFKNGRDFKIRLDPLMKEPAQTFRPYIALMHLYGKKLDWERLKFLQSEEYGQWLGDGFSASSILTTDYVWRPERNEVHFTCEEIPKPECITTRGSRYFHAIFDKRSGKVSHCDGAIRIYDQDEIELRQKFHVRQPEARKIGKRVKLFLINDEIDQTLFMNLATNFLVWNEDAISYFN